MSYEIIVDNEWATVRFETKDRYVYHTFHKPISGKFFRDTLNAGLDALINNHATKWLSDDRKNADFPPDDVQFAVADWGPRAAQAGWKMWALVVPEDIAGRISMSGIVEAFYDLGVHVAIFVDLEVARQWLLKH